MQPNEPIGVADRAVRYVAPDQLRIGLYVHIDLPWFLHPFALNSFRITSDEQIADLRSLRLKRYRFDPERSDERRDEVRDEVPPVASADPTAAAADDLPHKRSQDDPVLLEKEERSQRLREHRRTIAQTEKGFVKATTAIRAITRNLLLCPAQTREEMYQLVDQMASAFLERPDVSLHVMGENCGGEQAYLHGLNVFILSMMLARELDIGGEQARFLGIGALLHDIGKIELPDRVLMTNPDAYTRPERELYASHVECGIRVVKKLELAREVLEIIAQHHELADGSGYPRRLKLEQIAPLARVVSLVNYYDNLCNPVVLGQAMSPHEALSFIFARRRDHFDARMLQLMIRTLGVYPPGSIVRLSNDAIAMVISVNLGASLRPWVLLYDPGVPKHEAKMLDLQQEAGMSIAKCLRPALLPPTVHAYLSPGKRIAYFFDSEPPSTPRPA